MMLSKAIKVLEIRVRVRVTLTPVCSSCCFSPISGLFDEDELTGLVVEPFREELVGVVVVVVVFVGSGVEGFYMEKGPLLFFS